MRLDHAPRGEDEGDVHPLAYLLVSDGGRDPMTFMLEGEATSLTENDLAAHGSLAAAYVQMLRRFDNRMSAVAEYLLISPSYAYRCCARARRLATELRHIPVPAPDENRAIRPWRRFRLQRKPVQLTFDFDDELPLSPSPSAEVMFSEAKPPETHPH